MSRFPSEAEYEAATLAHWLDREPTLDEVSVTVRSGGEMCRFVLLRPAKPVIAFTPDDLRESPPAG
jgi:hypothetical protein